MSDAPPKHRLLVVSADEAELRLDQFLIRHLPGLSRREATELIRQGAVRVEGADPAARRPKPRKGARLRVGDRVHLSATTSAPGAQFDSPVPEAVKGVALVYEDDLLVVINKPMGIPCHPLRAHETGTVANHLAWVYGQSVILGGPPREFGLCHRLDNLTSGLLLAARTPATYQELRAQFREHRIEKRYLGLVAGQPQDHFEVTAAIESRRGRRRVRVGAGQEAATQFRVIERFPDDALVEARTHFGRRHQVRAHLAHAGHPLVADELYGGPTRVGWQRSPLLHATHLTLVHPGTKEQVTYQAPLSTEIREALDQLKKRNPSPSRR